MKTFQQFVNESTNNSINHIGGYNYSEKDQLEKAEHADLITLPEKIEGTNCSNCKFVKILNAEKGLGFCEHKELQMEVTARMCCKYWDAQGAERSWEKQK